MENLPGYDAWKTAYPPEYDEEDGFECVYCGDWIDDPDNEHENNVCDWCQHRINDPITRLNSGIAPEDRPKEN